LFVSPVDDRPGRLPRAWLQPQRLLSTRPASIRCECASNIARTCDFKYVRVQVLTPVGVLDRYKQLGVVDQLTEMVAAAPGDPRYTKRTWVLITESPEGG
jgi:hypothetical protein